MRRCLQSLACFPVMTRAVADGDFPNAPEAAPVFHDLVVCGDSSGAVVAAISAKREGRSVIWVNPTGFPGGMSASGLGAADFLGCRSTFGGIGSEFHDGVANACGTDFVRRFRPRVSRQVFEQMIKAAGVTVVWNERLDRTPGKGVAMDGSRITSITAPGGRTYRGKMFIDATCVGDFIAAAGVTFTVGREPESQHGKDMAGLGRGDTKPRLHCGQRDKDRVVRGVDPWVRPGDLRLPALIEPLAGDGRKVDVDDPYPGGAPHGQRLRDHSARLRGKTKGSRFDQSWLVRHGAGRDVAQPERRHRGRHRHGLRCRRAGRAVACPSGETRSRRADRPARGMEACSPEEALKPAASACVSANEGTVSELRSSGSLTSSHRLKTFY